VLLLLGGGAKATGDGPPEVVSGQETRGGSEARALLERKDAAELPRRSNVDFAERRPPVAADNWTFRPTVLVRRGTSQGSGTIIASIDGETLVLTAAHVVRDPGPIVVELHRYNLGMERSSAATGRWPRSVRATLVANDTAADLAILGIEKMRALPYVARLARDHAEPPARSTVTSIGIDLGTNLTGWSTKLVETVSFELNGSGDERPFLITEKIPEHGRSGGGLYLPSGELVGVCVGHGQLVKGKEMGVFASRESIRILLHDHKLGATITRSETRRSRVRSRSAQTSTAVREASSSGGTPSRSVDQKQHTPDIP
jgi:S1-C subfamily serine protease